MAYKMTLFFQEKHNSLIATQSLFYDKNPDS